MIQAPAIVRAEAASALRGLVLRGHLGPAHAARALDQVCAVRAILYPFEPFAARVWELRGTLSVYDAWYVALAEWLDSELVTADARLARAAGPRCPVRHVDDRPGG